MFEQRPQSYILMQYLQTLVLAERKCVGVMLPLALHRPNPFSHMAYTAPLIFSCELLNMTEASVGGKTECLTCHSGCN